MGRAEKGFLLEGSTNVKIFLQDELSKLLQGEGHFICKIAIDITSGLSIKCLKRLLIYSSR